MQYFNSEELGFYKHWANKHYDPLNLEHIDAKNTLMNTVWEKTLLIVKEIIKELPSLAVKGGKFWTQRGWSEINGKNQQVAIYKPYTWYKVHKSIDDGKDVFFTFGVDAHPLIEAFVYKIDLRRTRDSRLSREQQDAADKIIPEEAKWCTIPFIELIDLDFESIVSLCVNFISNNINHYDRVIEMINNKTSINILEENNLNLQNTPILNYAQTTKTRNFRGVDINFLEQNRELKIIGDKGEDLVILYEKKTLIKENRTDLADLVCKAKDGEGYDVLSVNLDGSKKYIEVKTTVGQATKPFFMSANELDFLRIATSYFIYRLYNFNIKMNSADFFILSDDVENNINLETMSYRITLK